jgi:CRP-like cAMP-binding protein
MDVAQALSGHWLFDGVDSGALSRACEGAERLTSERGETIYTPHRFRRCLGVLLSGSVQVSKQELVMSTLNTGDLFGAAALFTDSPSYATTLTALSDCVLVLLPQESVSRLLEESSVFARNYVRYLSERIQFLSRRLDAVSADTAQGKLGQYLLTNADETNQLTLSATQLSQRLGMGRATLYRAFEALEQDGAICREGKTIRILEREKLLK